MAHWIVIAYDEKCTSHDIEDNVNDNAHVIHNCIEADTAAEACEKARKEMSGIYEDLQAYRLDNNGILSSAERLDIAVNLLSENGLADYASQCEELEAQKKERAQL